MASGKMKGFLQAELKALQDAGVLKQERYLHSPQGAEVRVEYPSATPVRTVLNFCANNYLGLANHPDVVAAARKALDTHGYGLSSVRFICGTQDIHRELEQKIASFLKMEAAILHTSCFDANLGVFECLFKEEDAIITDGLNHASMVDGIRLSRAKRFIFAHNDMTDLELKLQAAGAARFRVIATDGVFSMDGDIAQLPKICDLAERHDALVLVDDSHATGFMGPEGRGTHEFCNVVDRIDIITTTFGKALGGASGGCVAGSNEIVGMLRQNSRPYLFSNTLSPAIVEATLESLNIIDRGAALRERLFENTRTFRTGMEQAGFRIKPGTHPIVPVMLGHLPDDARLSQEFAEALMQAGVFVTGFFYPVVPRGQARIRVQMSAAHSRDQVDFAIRTFTGAGRELGII